MTSPRRESESRSTSFYHVSLLLCYSSLSDQLSAWDGRSWEELEGVGRVGGQGRSNAVSEWRQRADPRTHSCHTATHFTSLHSGLFRFLWSFCFLFFCFRATSWGTRIPCAWTDQKGKLIFPPPDLEEFCRNRVCVCVSTAITQIIIPPLPLTVSRSRSRCCSSAHLPLEDYNTVNGAVYRCRVCLKCV